MAFAQRYVRCGNKRCRSCPHGPYWYEFAWSPSEHRMFSRYIGRERPEALPDPPTDANGEAVFEEAAVPGRRFLPSGWQDIFNRKTANRDLALKIMGLTGWPSRLRIKAAYLDLAKRNHPDIGGHPRVFAAIAAAFSYLDAVSR